MTEKHEAAVAWLRERARLKVHDHEPGEVIVNVYELKELVEDLVGSARAYSTLATCYRLNRRPNEAAWGRIDRARAFLLRFP